MRLQRRGASYTGRIAPSHPHDLRLRLRGHDPAYVRVGVGEISDISVRFSVVNLNRSLVPCGTDGNRHTVFGHIVGPRAALRDGASATLYLHGAVVPEATWRMPVRGYDYGYEQARRGHVSITVDQLGYGASSIPNGFFTCIGGQADIANQIVGQLRTGAYDANPAVSFDRIALAGHSAGQVTAEVAAVSFDSIDALLIGGWGDPGPIAARPAAALGFAETVTACVGGGEPKRPGSPGGYAFTFKDSVPELLFHDARTSVIEEYVGRHERDPCDPTLATAPIVNSLAVSQIEVPVFIFHALEDGIWPLETGERQRGLFAGSDDVTLVELADTGHMAMLERNAPALRTAISKWLRARGF